MNDTYALRQVRTKRLEIAYTDSGPTDGTPVVLMHGFPYTPRAYDVVVQRLAAAGCRAIVPYLRGYGATRFLDPNTPRSGQQAALGQDLVDFLEALQLPPAALVGYDWGGRAACIVAALWPQRARCLVSVCGYNIQHIAASVEPQLPEQEHRLWYQYYFHTERGRAGLTANRYALCRLLWRLWSPSWAFDEETYAASAVAFDNPDFVDVVIQSYRHRYGYAAGDPTLVGVEQRLAVRPRIGVPTTVLHGAGDGVSPVESSLNDARFFSGPYLRRVIPVVGHNLPQEAPEAIVQAVLELL